MSIEERQSIVAQKKTANEREHSLSDKRFGTSLAFVIKKRVLLDTALFGSFDLERDAAFSDRNLYHSGIRPSCVLSMATNTTAMPRWR